MNPEQTIQVMSRAELNTAETTIRNLNEAYVKAALGSDAGWFQTHLADEFVCIESDGSVLDKPAFLAMVAQASDLATYRLEEVDVRFYGAVALVRCTGAWRAKNGTPGISRYIDVYARFGHVWKAVSAQITRPA
jgi:Domain of unknown function (DUF4440)